MGPELIVEEQVWIHVLPPLIVGSFCVLTSLHDPMEGVLGDLSISLSISYKQKQRGKLPRKLKGSAHNLTMGYAPYC